MFFYSLFFDENIQLTVMSRKYMYKIHTYTIPDIIISPKNIKKFRLLFLFFNKFSFLSTSGEQQQQKISFVPRNNFFLPHIYNHHYHLRFLQHCSCNVALFAGNAIHPIFQKTLQEASWNVVLWQIHDIFCF